MHIRYLWVKKVDHFTITADLHLYCDHKATRSFIQIIFSIGAFAGLLIINLISDIKTRKYAAILALAIANLGSVCNFFDIKGAFLGGSYESVILLMLSQFCAGFGAYAFIPLAYTYFADFCSDKYRQKGVVFVNSGW
jgi:MFS family permease